MWRGKGNVCRPTIQITINYLLKDTMAYKFINVTAPVNITYKEVLLCRIRRFGFQQYKTDEWLPFTSPCSKCKHEQNGLPSPPARDSILLNKTYWRAREGSHGHRSIIRLSADVCAKGLDLIQSGSLMLRSQKTCRWERKRRDSGGIP